MRSIPTEYNNIQMKSRLESEIAYCLDNLHIKWEYEPKSFLLPSGIHYWPDFYLPEINQFIEGKGKITEDVIRILDEFTEYKKTDLILLSKYESMIFEDCDASGEGYDACYLGICSHCGKYYFESESGYYRCRHCGKRYDNGPPGEFSYYKYGQIEKLEGLEHLKILSLGLKLDCVKKK